MQLHTSALLYTVSSDLLTAIRPWRLTLHRKELHTLAWRYLPNALQLRDSSVPTNASHRYASRSDTKKLARRDDGQAKIRYQSRRAEYAG